MRPLNTNMTLPLCGKFHSEQFNILQEIISSINKKDANSNLDAMTIF